MILADSLGLRRSTEADADARTATGDNEDQKANS